MARGKKKESTLTPEEKLAQALVPVEEQPYKVPANWCWVYLPNVCDYIRAGGDKPSIFSEERTAELSVPVVANGVQNEGIIGFTDIENEKAGTVTVSGRGTIGYPILREYPYYPVVRLIVLAPNKAILPNYLKNVFFCLEEEGTGSSIPQLTVPMLKSKPVPVAPINEQQRIVDCIEYLFAKLDEAKEKAQSVVDSFEMHKAAILHKAFTGELTAKWRAEHGVSDDSWSTVDITRIAKTEKDALKAGPFGSALKKSMYVPEGYKVYGQEQVIAGDETIGDYYIDESKYQELISCKIAPHDILISLVGTVGKVLVLSNSCKPGIINPRLIKISLDENVMMPYFFKYYFESDSLKEMYKGESHGITMDVLNMRILKTLPFPLCNLAEQEEIVHILDNILSKEQQAKEAAEAVLEKIDLLKKSILARAFRGELGTNDPTEESALELLKRII